MRSGGQATTPGKDGSAERIRADALKPFWKRLRPSGAKIEAVAMDMSVAYRGAVSTHLPKAKIVFDHFHVIKLFNDKLSGAQRTKSVKCAKLELSRHANYADSNRVLVSLPVPRVLVSLLVPVSLPNRVPVSLPLICYFIIGATPRTISSIVFQFFRIIISSLKHSHKYSWMTSIVSSSEPASGIESSWSRRSVRS